MSDELELTLVTMQFDAHDGDQLQAVLAKYVVLARGHPGCRNIDLLTSATYEGRYLVVQKWESPAAQRAHIAGHFGGAVRR